MAVTMEKADTFFPYLCLQSWATLQVSHLPQLIQALVYKGFCVACHSEIALLKLARKLSLAMKRNGHSAASCVFFSLSNVVRLNPLHSLHKQDLILASDEHYILLTVNMTLEDRPNVTLSSQCPFQLSKGGLIRLSKPGTAAPKKQAHLKAPKAYAAVASGTTGKASRLTSLLDVFGGTSAMCLRL